MKVVLTLIGGPTALIEVAGTRLLTDPTFDEPQAYDAGTITLVKQTGPATDPASLLPIDAVLLSHDHHWDNLDRSGRAFLAQAPRVLTTPAGATRLGGSTEGLKTWESVVVHGPEKNSVRVTATPARHGPVGIEPVSGDVVGFVVTPENSSGSIYVSGDTVWYEGVAAIKDKFDIRLAILFTGAAQPRGTFHMTMGSNDAIEFAHAFPQAHIVAIHNEGWEHFMESQSELARSFATVGLASRLTSLERGVPVAFEV
ncbi:MBL fold metallo-hydrolase [Dyella subtropica]|uniref:MBL fold metallo-hydrolase n=1 Tax=Dyella subtropica TaxID=2992127 RepID=UPI002259C539|nr:MBL fold metallo-hydrolase [Dyella subtropica]